MRTLAYFLAAVAILFAAVEVAHAQDTCFKIGFKIEAGQYKLLKSHPTFGTYFNPYEHKEYMWVHNGRNIDMYDVSDKTTFDQQGNPTLAYTVDSGSSCIVGDTFVIGDDFYTYHGNEPFCTCIWSPSAPCPSQLSIKIDGQETLVTLGINSVIPVDTVSPDLIGSAALAFSDGLPGNGPAEEVCSPVVNIADVAGKICVINRGGCTFQSKHDRCLAAGGIGTIVVNRDNGVITMNVRDIEPQEVLIMIGRDSGDLITDALNMGKTVTLQVGRGTGPRAPLPEYSSPDPFGVVNVFTGKRDLLVSPFILADDIGVDWQRKLMYVFDVDGAIPEVNLVLNYTTTVDGAFPVVGSFSTGQEKDGSYRYIFYQGEKVYMLESSGWIGQVYIYDITGDKAANPELLSNISAPTCDGANPGFGGTQVHPGGEYIYLVDTYDAECGTLVNRRGENDVQVHEVWNVKDPSNPFKVNTFSMLEVEGGALTLNGAHWEFGPGDIAGISMTSSGFVLYDFSDPVNPVPASVVYDPAVNTNDFTRGVFQAAYGDDGFWYVYERDGADGVHGIWHQLKAVPCSQLGCPNY
jgi:hypothetical protein